MWNVCPFPFLPPSPPPPPPSQVKVDAKTKAALRAHKKKLRKEAKVAAQAVLDSVKGESVSGEAGDSASGSKEQAEVSGASLSSFYLLTATPCFSLLQVCPCDMSTLPYLSTLRILNFICIYRSSCLTATLKVQMSTTRSCVDYSHFMTIYGQWSWKRFMRMNTFLVQIPGCMLTPFISLDVPSRERSTYNRENTLLRRNMLLLLLLVWCWSGAGCFCWWVYTGCVCLNIYRAQADKSSSEDENEDDEEEELEESVKVGVFCIFVYMWVGACVRACVCLCTVGVNAKVSGKQIEMSLAASNCQLAWLGLWGLFNFNFPIVLCTCRNSGRHLAMTCWFKSAWRIVGYSEVWRKRKIQFFPMLPNLLQPAFSLAVVKPFFYLFISSIKEEDKALLAKLLNLVRDSADTNGKDAMPVMMLGSDSTA